MKKITDKSWLDTHNFGVRAFDPGGHDWHDGFHFRPPGLWNDCQDWAPEEECGGGFHLRTPCHNGSGFPGSIIELVEWRGELVPIGADKAKAKSLRRIPCSDDVLEEALRRCGVRVPVEDGDTINSGIAVILSGRPTIVQTGGELRIYGQSRPTIVQTGGELRIYGQSQPTIIQSDGQLRTYGKSRPTVAQVGGELWTNDQSRPTVAQVGGELWTNGESRPTIAQTGGRLWASDQSRPTVTQSGGDLRVYDESRPIIHAMGQL